MLKAGIVGLPNVGKSTLFNALIGEYQAEAGNFPFCTIDPNVGIVVVPDSKLETLAKIENSKKIIPASFEFVDIAGLVKGASEGAGLGNKFLSNIREVDAIVHVVRCFEDKNIHHVDGSINPIRDFETICLELALADLSVITKRIDRVAKTAKSGDVDAKKELAILNEIKPYFEDFQFEEILNIADEIKESLKHLSLLLMKKCIITANLTENELSKPLDNIYYAELFKTFGSLVSIIPISAQIEAELVNLAPEEQIEYLESLDVKESGIKTLIRTSFETLGLTTYFTAGEMEARAWTIPINALAPQAAGVIHTDFERGFIKAEVINFEELIACGNKAKARELGKLRLEGKDYIVKENDIIEFKFNV